MAGVGDLFDKLLAGSKNSPESKKTKDTSMIFGSYLGVELSLLIFFLSIVSLVILIFQTASFPIAIALLAVSVILLVVSMPIAFRVRKESSDGFSMLGFYMVLGLVIICGLSVWNVLNW